MQRAASIGSYANGPANSKEYEVRTQRGLKHAGEFIGDLARRFVLPHQRKGSKRDQVAKASPQLRLV
jgi:hypothetical protein